MMFSSRSFHVRKCPHAYCCCEVLGCRLVAQWKETKKIQKVSVTLENLEQEGCSTLRLAWTTQRDLVSKFNKGNTLSSAVFLQGLSPRAGPRASYPMNKGLKTEWTLQRGRAMVRHTRRARVDRPAAGSIRVVCGIILGGLLVHLQNQLCPSP